MDLYVARSWFLAINEVKQISARSVLRYMRTVAGMQQQFMLV